MDKGLRVRVWQTLYQPTALHRDVEAQEPGFLVLWLAVVVAAVAVVAVVLHVTIAIRTTAAVVVVVVPIRATGMRHGKLSSAYP